MRCPRCSNTVDAVEDWVCPVCDHILDASFLGEDITRDAKGFDQEDNEKTRMIAWAFEPRGEESVPDALILGDVSVSEDLFSVVPGADFVGDETSALLFYSNDATSRCIQSNATPVRVGGTSPDTRLTPYQRSVLEEVGQGRTVRDIRRRLGLAPAEIAATLLSLIDKKLIQIERGGPGRDEALAGETPTAVGPVPGVLDRETTQELSLVAVDASDEEVEELNEAVSHEEEDSLEFESYSAQVQQDFRIPPSAVSEAETPPLPLEAIQPSLDRTTGPRTPTFRPVAEVDARPKSSSPPPAPKPKRTSDAPLPPPSVRRPQESVPHWENHSKAESLYEQALKDANEGNVVSGRMNMKLALAFDPTNPAIREAFERLSQMQTSSRKTEARSEIQEFYDAATEAEKRGQIDEAIRLLRKAIQTSPHAACYNRLGVILATKKREFNEAQLLLHKAIQLDPRNPIYAVNLQKTLAAAATRMMRDESDQRSGTRKKSSNNKSGSGGLLGLFGRKN
jgi:Flp pilus assembly protein TadD/DNA-binding MarR family transcriptional regulator